MYGESHSLTKGSRFRKTLVRIIAVTMIAAITTLSPVSVWASLWMATTENYYFCWTNDKGTVNYQIPETTVIQLHGTATGPEI